MKKRKNEQVRSGQRWESPKGWIYEVVAAYPGDITLRHIASDNYVHVNSLFKWNKIWPRPKD